MSNKEDFDAFFAGSHDDVVRALTLALGDRTRAEDGAQEAYAKAYRQWHRVTMMDRPVAWVYVVALRGARRELKRDTNVPMALPSAPPADLAGSVAVRAYVLGALDMLAPRQRVAIVLRYLADLQVNEVAEAMGCSLGTAKATLHVALTRMRVHLEPDPPTLSDLSASPAPPASFVGPPLTISPDLPETREVSNR